MNSKFDEIKKFIKNECKKNGVRFYHGRGKTVIFPTENIRSNGFFSEEWGDIPPTLAIASNEHALATMVHEYCHMLQYLEAHPVWTALEGRGQMWSWLNGEDFPDEVIDESVESYMNVELDCEIRSVEFHRMWNTGINLEEYIQRANSYILFYKFLREERSWYKPQREPYTLHAVWSQMPKTFDFDHEDWYNNNRSIFQQCIKG